MSTLFHEILVLFSHLAAVTETLELVTSVLILPQRQTAVVAKQVSTIDLLSGGRLRLAVGVGWNWAEYGALGTDFATREERLEEQIAVMRLLWTEPLVTLLRPVPRDGPGRHQPAPHPTDPGLDRHRRLAPGTAAGGALRRRLDAAPAARPGPVGVVEAVARLRRIAEEAGRDPATLPIHGRIYLGDQFEAQLEQAQELGFSDLSIGFNRMANPGHSHAEQLEQVIEAKATVDRLLG